MLEVGIRAVVVTLMTVYMVVQHCPHDAVFACTIFHNTEKWINLYCFILTTTISYK